MQLHKQTILAQLEPAFHPEIYIFDSVLSTNDTAKTLPKTAHNQPLIVLANAQTGGKGRLGRSFFSPPGQGLYMSIRLHIKEQEFTLLSAAAGVAVCKAMETLYHLTPKIKWVNDICLQDKKLCGILVENLSAGGSTPNSTIIGIGINLSTVFPPDLQERATCLCRATNCPIDKNSLAAQIANHVCNAVAMRDQQGLIKQYRARSMMPGRQVTVFHAGKSYQAQAVDIAPNGGLIVRTEDDQLQTLTSGEVTLRFLPDDKIL